MDAAGNAGDGEGTETYLSEPMSIPDSPEAGGNHRRPLRREAPDVPQGGRGRGEVRRQVDARLLPVFVVQAQLDLVRDFGEEREVRALAVPPGTERERLAGPEPHSSSRTDGARRSTSWPRKTLLRISAGVQENLA
mgnify:CR=1 FL=1